MTWQFFLHIKDSMVISILKAQTTQVTFEIFTNFNLLVSLSWCTAEKIYVGYMEVLRRIDRSAAITFFRADIRPEKVHVTLVSFVSAEKCQNRKFLIWGFLVHTKLILVTWTILRPYICSEKAISDLLWISLYIINESTRF